VCRCCEWELHPVISSPSPLPLQFLHTQHSTHSTHSTQHTANTQPAERCHSLLARRQRPPAILFLLVPQITDTSPTPTDTSSSPSLLPRHHHCHLILPFVPATSSSHSLSFSLSLFPSLPLSSSLFLSLSLCLSLLLSSSLSLSVSLSLTATPSTPLHGPLLQPLSTLCVACVLLVVCSFSCFLQYSSKI